MIRSSYPCGIPERPAQCQTSFIVGDGGIVLPLDGKINSVENVGFRDSPLVTGFMCQDACTIGITDCPLDIGRMVLPGNVVQVFDPETIIPFPLQGILQEPNDKRILGRGSKRQ